MVELIRFSDFLENHALLPEKKDRRNESPAFLLSKGFKKIQFLSGRTIDGLRSDEFFERYLFSKPSEQHLACYEISKELMT